MKIDWQAALITTALIGGSMGAGAVLASSHDAPAATPDCRDGAQWGQTYPATGDQGAYTVTWTCTAGKILPTIG